jgi:hypothetical protein
LAGVRQRVSKLLGLNCRHLDAESVLARYAALLAIKRAKGKDVVEEEATCAQGELAFL